jgi:hypothetical protein
MEDLKEKLLQDISVWWEQTNKYGTKRPVWRVYHSNTKSAKGKKAQENTEITDIDSSFEFLIDSLNGTMPYLEKYILVSLYTNKTDAAPVQMCFVNPMYVENQVQQSNSINGFQTSSNGQQVIQTGYTKQDVDKMVSERLEAYKTLHQTQIDSLRKEFEYQKRLEDMQAQIEGISEGQKNTVDKILGIMEHPVIGQVVAGLMGKFLGVPENSVPVKTKVAGNIEDEENGESFSDDDEQFEEKVAKSMDSLEKVFPNESADVLSELSVLAEQNPDILKQLRGTLRQMIQKK